jgi:hypothetical protein
MAYFISNTVYATDNLKIVVDYSVPFSVDDDFSLVVHDDYSLPELISHVNSVYVANSVPVTLKTDGEKLYIENNEAGEEITYIDVTAPDSEALVAFGTSWSLVDGKAEASNFGAFLPFEFILKSPAHFSYVSDQSGGVQTKKLYDKKLAGDTHNGVNKSTSSKVIHRTGWQFMTHFNEAYKADWFWWLESCRNTFVTMVGVDDYGMDGTVEYDIQPNESETRTMIYAHLNIWEVNIALLGRPKP